MRPRFTAALLALPLLALPCATAATAGGLMDHDTDFCAKRTYGEAHLKDHPTQTVTGISISSKKGWNVAVGRDLPYREPTIMLSVTTWERLWDTQLLTCTDYDEDVPATLRAPGAFYCSTLCRGGTVRIVVTGDTLTLTAPDFPRHCDLPALDGKGDRVFVLKRAPVETCAFPPDWPRDEAGLAALKAKMRKAFSVE